MLGFTPSRLRSPAVDTRPLIVALAGLSAGAAAIHAAVVPEHAKEYWPFAVFFAAVALLQGGWALALVRRRRSPGLFVVGIATSAALLALWIVSRTAGIPLGPEAWKPEPVAFRDLLAGTLEAGIILASAANLRAHRQRPPAKGATPDPAASPECGIGSPPSPLHGFVLRGATRWRAESSRRQQRALR